MELLVVFGDSGFREFDLRISFNFFFYFIELEFGVFRGYWVVFGYFVSLQQGLDGFRIFDLFWVFWIRGVRVQWVFIGFRGYGLYFGQFFLERVQGFKFSYYGKESGKIRLWLAVLQFVFEIFFRVRCFVFRYVGFVVLCFFFLVFGFEEDVKLGKGGLFYGCELGWKEGFGWVVRVLL